MKYAIFSDVHSNLNALTELFHRLENDPEVLPVCLGDVVGYASKPRECLRFLHERDVPMVMGNHDYAFNHDEELVRFNEYAKAAILWQRTQLTETDAKILSQLPFTIEFDGLFSVAHADFSNPPGFIYVIDQYTARMSFASMNTPIGFIGHTHVPFVVAFDPDTKAIDFYSIEKLDISISLDPKLSYLINPGSVGQPRDGDPRGSYLLFDTDCLSVSFHRFDYNYEDESQRILDARLPASLAERIQFGH